MNMAAFVHFYCLFTSLIHINVLPLIFLYVHLLVRSFLTFAGKIFSHSFILTLTLELYVIVLTKDRFNLLYENITTSVWLKVNTSSNNYCAEGT